MSHDEIFGVCVAVAIACLIAGLLFISDRTSSRESDLAKYAIDHGCSYVKEQVLCGSMQP
jgi:hypothetical protein